MDMSDYLKRLSQQTGIILPLVWMIAFSVLLVGCSDSDLRKIPPLLKAARLAPLPHSATNISYYEWNGFGTGNAYVRFSVMPADLNLFLTNSPALYVRPPIKQFDSKHHHLSIPPASYNNSSSPAHYYHLQGPQDPKWFRPAVTNRGRMYKLDYNQHTWILIDEDKHIVWIFSSRG
jgi:hypothetical protein